MAPDPPMVPPIARAHNAPLRIVLGCHFTQSMAPDSFTGPIQRIAHNASLRAKHRRLIAHSTTPTLKQELLAVFAAARAGSHHHFSAIHTGVAGTGRSFPLGPHAHRAPHGGHPHGIHANSGPRPLTLTRHDTAFPALQTLSLGRQELPPPPFLDRNLLHVIAAFHESSFSRVLSENTITAPGGRQYNDSITGASMGVHNRDDKIRVRGSL
ncbi:hypothetical protein H0H92_004648 [Tricholoma furcatifolium]|nr:hypothetical protein H0H92_004648 [Tricholoma furcatifolium]